MVIKMLTGNSVTYTVRSNPLSFKFAFNNIDFKLKKGGTKNLIKFSVILSKVKSQTWP